MAERIDDEVIVHRLGGANFALRQQERNLNPVGVSVFIGGDADEAVAAMRGAFGSAGVWRPPLEVASATIRSIRAVGFDVVWAKSRNFENHGRLIHPNGLAGFTVGKLEMLASVFVISEGH